MFSCSASRGKVKPLEVRLKVNGQTLAMEIDTGASLSIVSEATYQRHWPQQRLSESHVNLRTYTGELLKVRLVWR